MKKYTLVKQFTDRFRTNGRQRVRSKEGRFLEENFVLKKRECEREEEKRDP
jgi:hypothetical protein